jgi:anti-sigma B factor antagonist
MSTDQLEITTLARGDTGLVRVEVSGDLDQASAPQLRECLNRVIADRPAEVEIDLLGVTFFSCAGLEVLVAAREALDGHLVVVGAGRSVQRLLEVLQIQTLFGLPETGRAVPPETP